MSFKSSVNTNICPKILKELLFYDATVIYAIISNAACVAFLQENEQHQDIERRSKVRTLKLFPIAYQPLASNTAIYGDMHSAYQKIRKYYRSVYNNVVDLYFEML